MTNYDFLNLSPYDFEILSRDLLQKHLNVHLESYPIGKDQGIDLKSDNQTGIVVQCKRYRSFNDLSNCLKKHENIKINKITYKRYILITSVDLAKTQKDKIIDILSSANINSGDIIGKNDLNNLLTQYPEVERSHFKLWLSSSEQINNIIDKGIINYTRFQLDTMKRSIEKYVVNESYNEALRIMQKNKYVIISGIPGIGKTTLAEMLILSLLPKEYDEFICISDNIQQGFDLYNPDKRQLFFYDDFLGVNFIKSPLGINQDKKIISFIKQIKDNKNANLIFTTREYILNQAKNYYESFALFDFSSCIIDLSKYTNLEKAKILYNHLFYNNIPVAYVNEMINQKYIDKIIKHISYNPRTIDDILKQDIINNCNSKSFPKYFYQILENPRLIWSHAYYEHISEMSRIILNIMHFQDKHHSYSDILLTLTEYYKQNKINNNLSTFKNEFKKSLKELENTFISISKNQENNLILNYQNPSIRDYLINEIDINDTFVQNIIYSNQFIFDSIELISTKPYIRNKAKNHIKAETLIVFENKFIEYFEALLKSNYSFIENKDIVLEIINNVQRLVFHYKYRDNETLINCIRKTISILQKSDYIIYNLSDYLYILNQMSDIIDIDLENTMLICMEYATDISEIDGFMDLRDIDNQIFANTIDKYNDSYNQMIGNLVETAKETNNHDYDDAIEDLERIMEVFDFDTSNEIEYFLNKRNNIEDIYDEDYWRDNHYIESNDSHNEDQIINSLFRGYEVLS